jgi:hypothetical protein
LAAVVLVVRVALAVLAHALVMRLCVVPGVVVGAAVLGVVGVLLAIVPVALGVARVVGAVVCVVRVFSAVGAQALVVLAAFRVL